MICMAPQLIWRPPVRGRAKQLALILLQLQHALLYAALHHISAQYASSLTHGTQVRALMIPLPRTVIRFDLSASYVQVNIHHAQSASSARILRAVLCCTATLPVPTGLLQTSALQHRCIRDTVQGPGARTM